MKKELFPSGVNSVEQPQKHEKEKFIDVVRKVIEEMMKQSPTINYEKMLSCRGCEKKIDKESTEYFQTPQGFFHSTQCALEKGHHNYCTCEMCGTKEELEEVFNEILPKFREIHQMSGGDYALVEAREILRKKKKEEFIKKYK